MDCTEMISKMDKQRKWKNVNNEEGRTNYRKLKKKSKRATARLRRDVTEAYVTESWNCKE